MLEKNCFIIKPPDVTEKTEFYLMLHRTNPGPFGGMGSPYVFGIDMLQATQEEELEDKKGKGKILSYAGYVKDGDKYHLRIMFPAGANFMLVDRSVVEQIDSAAAAQMQNEEDEAVREVLSRGASKAIATPDHSPDESRGPYL